MNLKLSAAGFAIQAAKGTSKAQPDFWGPVGGGALVTLGVEQTEDELTSAEVGGIGEFRQSVAVAADYETRAWPASIGGLLYAVLGAIESTGAAGAYTHVITAASELPWATVFGAKDKERKSSVDSKCDELKIEWEANGPLKVTGTWAGCDVAYSAVAYVPVLDEALLDYFKGIHLGTTTIDLDGSGYDGGATVLGGVIDIKRNLSADAESGVLLSSGLNEGAIEIDVELKCRVPDLLPVRLLLTGAVDGQDVTAVVPYGDFTLGFTDPDGHGLSMTAKRVAWTTEEPDADPKGGPGELTFKGRCYGPAADDLFTATVLNDHATYVGA